MVQLLGCTVQTLCYEPLSRIRNTMYSNVITIVNIKDQTWQLLTSSLIFSLVKESTCCLNLLTSSIDVRNCCWSCYYRSLEVMQMPVKILVPFMSILDGNKTCILLNFVLCSTILMIVICFLCGTSLHQLSRCNWCNSSTFKCMLTNLKQVSMWCL